MARGGSRVGAGRKKKDEKKQQIPVYVAGELADYLREQGATRVVEETVPRSKAFREWKLSRKNLPAI